MKDKSKPNRFSRKVLAIGLALTIACSVTLSLFVTSPGDLFGGISQTAPIVEVLPAEQTKNGSEAQFVASARIERRRDRLRKFFLSQTSVLRGILLLPFWILGKSVLFFINLLFPALGSIMQPVFGVFLHAILLFGLFALIFKLLFPNIPLHKFFSKRNISLLLVSAVVLSAADAILHAYCEDYQLIRKVINLCLEGLVLSLLCWRIFGPRKTGTATGNSIYTESAQ